MVIPNAADVDFYKPRPYRSETRWPHHRVLRPDVLHAEYRRRELVHPGDLATDRRGNPDARCKIIGVSPSPQLLTLSGPRIEFTGVVPDLDRTLRKPRRSSCRCGSAVVRV